MKFMLKSCLLLSLILLTATFMQFQKGWAYPIKETIFASGMDLLFIDSFDRYIGAETPYRQMLFDVSPWENHAYVYPNSQDSSTYAGPELVWGKMGKALNFGGGSEFVNTSDSSSLDLTEKVTIDFWVYMNNVNASKQWITFIGKGDNAYRMQLNYGNVSFSINHNATDYYDLTVNWTMPIHKWYYLAGVFDGIDLNIYVNGELNDTASDAGVIHTNNYGLSIAENSEQTNRRVDGIIDEVRVYPLALTEDEVYNDMITPIAGFNKYLFIASKEYNGNWYEGFVTNRTGIRNNDIDLPWVTAPAGQEWELYVSKYIPSFQSFRSYCTLKKTGADASSTCSLLWKVAFFRNGEIQSEYIVGIANPQQRTWSIMFALTYPNEFQYADYSWTFDSNTQANYAPVVVDIWVGPDSKHISMRVTAENATTTEPHSWSYSFDLLNRDGNIMPIGVFDGWVRLEYRVMVDSYDVESTFEIASHKGLWESVTGFFKTVVNAISGATNTVVTAIEPVIKPVTEIFEPVIQQVTNASDPLGAMIQNAIGGLAHELYGAVGTLGKTMGDSLGGVGDILLGIGNIIVQSIISFSSALMTAFEPFTGMIWNAFSGVGTLVWNAFSGIADLIWNTFDDFLAPIWTALTGLFDTFVAFADYMLAWTGYDTLFSDFLVFIGELFSWFATTIVNLPQILTEIFDIVAITFTRTIQTTTSLATGLVNIFTTLWYVLETAWGGAMSIADLIAPFMPLAGIAYIIYLVYLFEDEGFEGILNHINMLIDIAHFFAWLFITIPTTIVNFIDQYIESIPVVE